MVHAFTKCAYFCTRHTLNLEENAHFFLIHFALVRRKKYKKTLTTFTKAVAYKRFEVFD